MAVVAVRLRHSPVKELDLLCITLPSWSLIFFPMFFFLLLRFFHLLNRSLLIRHSCGVGISSLLSFRPLRHNIFYCSSQHPWKHSRQIVSFPFLVTSLDMDIRAS